jgi:hypothetical protein
MRAALAEVAEDGKACTFGVAIRSAHAAACGCDDQHCQDRMPRPSRTALVSARRALYALAELGEARIIHIAGDDGGRVLYAYKCCQQSNDCQQATLKLPSRPEGCLPTYRQFLRALDAMRKCCPHRAADGNTYAPGGAP